VEQKLLTLQEHPSSPPVIDYCFPVVTSYDGLVYYLNDG
jgi:hypothetical protein